MHPVVDEHCFCNRDHVLDGEPIVRHDHRSWRRGAEVIPPMMAPVEPGVALPSKGGGRFDAHPGPAARLLIIATGVSGQLPIMPELYEEARRRGVEIVAEPTEAACRRLQAADPRGAAAVLHVTC